MHHNVGGGSVAGADEPMAGKLPFQGGAVGLCCAAAKVFQEVCRHGNIIEGRARRHSCDKATGQRWLKTQPRSGTLLDAGANSWGGLSRKQPE